MTREEVVAYGCALAGVSADRPFKEDFESTVLRHGDTGKWFGLLMYVNGDKVGREGKQWIVNLKVDPELSAFLRSTRGWILPAYHMHKRLWVSVVLSEAETQEVYRLIDHSYERTR